MDTHFVAVHEIFDALRCIPGCLGVELAHSESGRHSILAWFEDKDALVRRYFSSFHKNLQRTYFPDETPGEPLAHVAYPGGPIITIASFTLAHEMDPASLMLSLKEITVDLFSPLSADTLLGTGLDSTHLPAA
ncbi:MAG: hypothetical protein ACRDHY_03970 [Anaerolineales bacterium]